MELESHTLGSKNRPFRFFGCRITLNWEQWFSPYRWLVHSLLRLLINFYPSSLLTMPIMNLQLLFLKPANRIPKSYNKKDALLLKFDWYDRKSEWIVRLLTVQIAENFWLKQFLDYKWRIELELWPVLPKLRSSNFFLCC